MKKSLLPSLVIKGKKIPVCIIQGGMGIGVSLYPLAKAVAEDGGAGIISSAALDRLISKRSGKKVNSYDAAYEEVSLAKTEGGFAGINIMVALIRDFEDSVRGALDAGADCIISGAGLPLNLPAIQDPKDTALIPIVSSARALDIIRKKWEKLGYRPDAVVLEGPLAGGHLGFKFSDIEKEENLLENLFPLVKDIAIKYGNFPVIVAGGIYTHADILRFVAMGADGVQMGTRFLATEKSSATSAYKQAVINCKKEDIVIADPETNPPGSPCGLPFRVIKQSPMFMESKFRKPFCDKGYVLRKDAEGKFTICPARYDCEKYLNICSGLLASAGCIEDLALYTVGTNAYRVDKILSVKELMDRLKGITPDD